MSKKDLAQQHCVPCEGGIPPLDKVTAREYLADLAGWNLVSSAQKITKKFSFKDFKEALEFTNKVGRIAETEGHHPDILLSWGSVVITLWTHAIGGLSENDFIVATKINLL